MSAGISYVKKKKKNCFCFLISPHQPLHLQCRLLRWWVFSECVALGKCVPASEIHKGCAEGHDLLHKHDGSGREKRPAAFASTFIKRVSCCALRAHFY